MYGKFSGKQSACNAGDTGSIPGSGRSLGGENGNALQDSCLGKAMDRGAWQARTLSSTYFSIYVFDVYPHNLGSLPEPHSSSR